MAAVAASGTGRCSRRVVGWHTDLSSAAVGVADLDRDLRIAVAEVVAGVVVGIAVVGRAVVEGRTAVAGQLVVVGQFAVAGRFAVGMNLAVLAETGPEEMTSYNHCIEVEGSAVADKCSAGTGYLVSEYSTRMGSPRRATPVDFERRDCNYLVWYFAGYFAEHMD